jgi:hypothetical protein
MRQVVSSNGQRLNCHSEIFNDQFSIASNNALFLHACNPRLPAAVLDLVSSRFILLCLLAAFYQAQCQAADTNLTAIIDCGGHAEAKFLQAPATNLVATGEWSKALEDGHGHKLRTRITVYETMPDTHVAPVYLEIQDLQGTNKPPTQFYFDVQARLHVELRDANDQPAEKLRHLVAFGLSIIPGFWATVPAGGLLRLHANSGLGSGAKGGAGDLNLLFRSGPDWIIPAGNRNAYFLSATIAAVPADSKPADDNAWQGPLPFPAVRIFDPAIDSGLR